mmetsp:Transcript_11993/g.17305  ORF Transcript_11993/g.17305 Transcript_11993/m.17305 type:complete len:100 (-) Transcript_11993:19-318(-)
MERLLKKMCCVGNRKIATAFGKTGKLNLVKIDTSKPVREKVVLLLVWQCDRNNGTAAARNGSTLDASSSACEPMCQEQSRVVTFDSSSACASELLCLCT